MGKASRPDATHQTIGKSYNGDQVAVFGGEGFIGRHLVKVLRELGFQVYSLDKVRRSSGHDEFFIQCDVRNEIDLPTQIQPKWIFNLAAIHKNPGHKSYEYYETNISGAVNVINFAEKVGCEKYLFTSSIAIYGDQESKIFEDSPKNPVSDYGKSKLMAELIHDMWSQKTKVKVYICRPSVIFGKGERGNFTRLVSNISKNRFFIPFGREVIKPCGYVKDLVSAMLHVIRLDRDRLTFNFAFPENYSIGEITSSIAILRETKRPLALNLTKFLSGLRIIGLVKFATIDRMLKLSRSVEVSTDLLKNEGFNWRFTLDSALRDWEKESDLDRNSE